MSYHATVCNSGYNATGDGVCTLQVSGPSGTLSYSPSTIQICPSTNGTVASFLVTSTVNWDVYASSGGNGSSLSGVITGGGPVSGYSVTVNYPYVTPSTSFYLVNSADPSPKVGDSYVLATALVNGTTTGCPDFSITDNTNTSQTVPQGSSPTYAVTVNAINGFSGNVTLSNSSCPTNATCTFSPNPTTPGTVNLIISNTASTPGGTYNFTPSAMVAAAPTAALI